MVNKVLPFNALKIISNQRHATDKSISAFPLGISLSSRQYSDKMASVLAITVGFSPYEPSSV